MNLTLTIKRGKEVFETPLVLPNTTGDKTDSFTVTEGRYPRRVEKEIIVGFVAEGQDPTIFLRHYDRMGEVHRTTHPDFFGNKTANLSEWFKKLKEVRLTWD